jgi:hypothetical protein
MGTGLTAVQTILEARAGDGYGEDIAATIRRSLGLTRDDATSVAGRPLPALPSH